MEKQLGWRLQENGVRDFMLMITDGEFSHTQWVNYSVLTVQSSFFQHKLVGKYRHAYKWKVEPFFFEAAKWAIHFCYREELPREAPVATCTYYTLRRLAIDFEMPVLFQFCNRKLEEYQEPPMIQITRPVHEILEQVDSQLLQTALQKSIKKKAQKKKKRPVWHDSSVRIISSRRRR